MYFFDLNKISGEAVTYSTAAGRPVDGEHLQVSLLHFETHGGAEEHAHPYEQIMYVIRGKLRVQVGDEVSDIGPGQAFLAPANVKHQVTALEDSEVISCKDIL